MSYRNLAEAIILQSIEDLWHPLYSKESRDFFNGDGFSICAEIAGLNSIKKLRLLNCTVRRNNGRTYGVYRY